MHEEGAADVGALLMTSRGQFLQKFFKATANGIWEGRVLVKRGWGGLDF